MNPTLPPPSPGPCPGLGPGPHGGVQGRLPLPEALGRALCQPASRQYSSRAPGPVCFISFNTIRKAKAG